MWMVSLPLKSACPVPLESEDSNWKACARPGTTTLLLEWSDSADGDTILTESLRVAQRLLADFCVDTDIVLEVAAAGVSACRTHDGGTTIIPPAVAVAVDAGRATVITTDRDGVATRPPTPSPVRVTASGSKASPYYHKAVKTRDTYDRARNFCLAIEFAGDILRNGEHLTKRDTEKLSRDGKSEEQGLWVLAIREYLKTTAKLPSKAAGQIAPSRETDQEAKDLASVLYNGIRCELFHAKQKKPKKLPYDRQSEAAVKKALPVLRDVARAAVRAAVPR